MRSGLSRAAVAREALPAFLLFAALAALARASSFRAPLAEDSGVYLYVGQVILDGGVPYADAADNKGPLTYLLFAFVRLVAGDSGVLVRLTLLLFAALAALAVAAYVRRFAKRGAALLAGGVSAILGSTPVLEGADPNTEQYGIAPLAGALWLSVRGTRRSAAGAGALTAAAGLMNPGFLPLALPVAAGLWIEGSRDERGARLVWATLTGAALAAAFAAWIAVAGALPDFWTQVVGKASSAVSGGEAGDDLFGSRPLFAFAGRGLYALGALGALAGLCTRATRLPAATALLWLVVCWLRVKLSSYEFAHHFQLGVPGLAAGLGSGAAALAEKLQARPRGLRLVAAAALVGVLGVATWSYVGRYERDALAKQPVQRAAFPRYAEAYPIGDFIRRNTQEGDEIFVAGNNATVYWRADRLAPTRFFADYPLVEPKYGPERRRKLLADPPVAVATLPGGSFFIDDTREVLRRHPYRLALDRGGGSRVWLLSPRR